MQVIKRRGSEAYPSAFGGISASAQMPFAQLGLSADVPFIAGADTLVPFDTVVYQSRAFGGFEEDVSGISTFFVPFGVYLAVLQLDVDTTPTQLDTAMSVQSGSGVAAASISSALGSSSLSMSAVRLGSETPTPGHVLPVFVQVAMEATGGGNGNITAAFTKLFVQQLTQFQET